MAPCFIAWLFCFFALNNALINRFKSLRADNITKSDFLIIINRFNALPNLLIDNKPKSTNL